MEITTQLKTMLKDAGYNAKVIHKNEAVGHYDLLVMNSSGYGVAFINVAIHDGKASVYGGQVLNLPSEFVDVYQALDGKKVGAKDEDD